MQNNKIAQGFTTASKHPSQWVKNQPKFYEDLEDKSRDFVCGLGCNLVGWNNCYSLPTHYEEELAGRICELFPFVDKVKILKTGTDACNAAVRIARAYAREQPLREQPSARQPSALIKSFYDGVGAGYHGWGNSFISVEHPGNGTVQEDYFKCLNLNELINTLINSWGIDYCIIEPVELDLDVLPQLKEIRRLCSEKGIVLIFDEIITGFRVPEYSISNYFGVTPDLICLGKALGNGYPISILGGKAEIMETPNYFISGTFFGEMTAINEALKTLDFLTLEKLDELWHRGACFQRKLNIIHPDVQLVGYPTRAVWEGKYKYVFWQEMAKKGWLLGKAWFLNFDHTPELLNTFIEDARKILKNIDKVKLNGPEPTPIFKR